MSGPSSWQEELRQRLATRNRRDSSYATIIDQYRRLAQQTKILKERNGSLLKAVGSVRSNPNASTVLVGAGDEDNPVRAAYTASLESQISSLRDELAAVYKTQGQNAQRLVAMNDALREKEEQLRLESQNHRQVADELFGLRKKVDQHKELMTEKDRTAQILHDEIATLQLELGQVEERNQALSKDNAVLLQRWLDAKQNEANIMNEANQFHSEMKAKHDATQHWQNGNHDFSDTASQSGNDEALGNPPSTRAMGGKVFQQAERLTLNQSG